ncbi:MAG: hypothetical protein LAP87_10980 [Acidobacteriia bacterium]|nr:hypothetical protein [Terriglobia bacterium]
MIKLISSGLAVFAGVVSLPVGGSHQPTMNAPAADYRQDPRFEALHRFFQKSDCPAARYAREFLEAADHYELDWRLLPSISYVESTGGKSARNNNLFGWDSGRARFPSAAEGIQIVGYRLAHSEIYKDKSLDELLALYNPDEAYGQKIKSVMRRIAPSQ